MTKIEAMKEHIALREQFFEMKFHMIGRYYGMFRMMFHKQELIEGASAGLRTLICEYGHWRNYVNGQTI